MNAMQSKTRVEIPPPRSAAAPFDKGGEIPPPRCAVAPFDKGGGERSEQGICRPIAAALAASCVLAVLGHAAVAVADASTAGSPHYDVQAFRSCGQIDRVQAAADGPYLVVSRPLEHHVLVYDSTETPPRLLTVIGQLGTKGGQFNVPSGVAIDARRQLLYVSDTFNHRVQLFKLARNAETGSWEGRFMKAIGKRGTHPGRFNEPGALALDRDGNLYVADLWNARIQVFDPQLKFIREWGRVGKDDGAFSAPLDLAINPDSGTLYIVDGGNQRVQAFDTKGNFLFAWGEARREEDPESRGGMFLYPYSVAIGHDGNVFVADCSEHNVQEFDAKGRYLGRWGQFGVSDGRLNQPRQIVADPKGRLLVIDYGSRRGQFFSNGGEFQTGFTISAGGH